MTYTDVLDRVKPGKYGSAEITHDTPDSFTRMMAGIRGMPLGRNSYCRLLVNGGVVMTDAEFERRTNATFMREASGHTLIAGLGIGLILDPLLKRCDSVTVIEINADVIALISPSFPSATVHHASIFEWEPSKGAKYDTIYFDIWPHFNKYTNAQATKLHRKFRKYLTKGGYMESWTRVAMKATGRL